MRASHDLMTHADYARVLRRHLDPAVFRPCPSHLWRVAFHGAVLLGGYLALRMHWPYTGPACALLIGHSIACLGFLAHDVSHHAVVRSRTAIRVLELVLFGLNVTPPTVWRRVHNHAHHAQANTIRDPDRRLGADEHTPATRRYARTFYPEGASWLRAPLVFCHWIAYVVRNTVAALLPGGRKPSMVPFKPSYSARQRLTLLAELLWLGVLQMGIWHLVGTQWETYLWASAGLLVASGVAMMYIFTNHFLNPLCDHSDPLVGSLSVMVPPWMDWLHDNFSYHTEHHLFPGMNPRHFPEVSRLLQQHFPDRYNRLPLGEAWRRLWAETGNRVRLLGHGCSTGTD